MDQIDPGRDWWTPDGWIAGTRPEQRAYYREARGAAAQGGLDKELEGRSLEEVVGYRPFPMFWHDKGRPISGKSLSMRPKPRLELVICGSVATSTDADYASNFSSLNSIGRRSWWTRCRAWLNGSHGCRRSRTPHGKAGLAVPLNPRSPT